MFDDGVLGKLFSAASGVWALVCMAALALFKAWPLILGRLNERQRDKAKEKDGDWSRLRTEIKRLDDRCDHLQHEVDECREREGVWMSRAIAAEAALLGEGNALQAAQRIVSADREEMRKKDKPGNGA